MSIRPVKRLISATPHTEGAGVKLRRAFGFGNTSEFDPFLLFDDFRNDRPADYLAGFPWHPHRGIETITYVLAGNVEHGDSLGNRGSLGAGDVQWMTAGSGILHQEMPKGDEHGRMHGFQLWANLPASLKMTDPRYQDIPSVAIPEVTADDGTRARIICGTFWGKTGPVDGIAAGPSGALRQRRRRYGTSGGRGNPVPAGFWPAGGVVRTDRDEHTGRTPTCVPGTAGGDVPETVGGGTRAAIPDENLRGDHGD